MDDFVLSEYDNFDIQKFVNSGLSSGIMTRSKALFIRREKILNRAYSLCDSVTYECLLNDEGTINLDDLITEYHDRQMSIFKK